MLKSCKPLVNTSCSTLHDSEVI